MTMMTLEQDITQEKKLLEDARTALAAAREEIELLRDALARADVSDAVKAASDIKRINQLFSTCVDTENRIAKLKQETAGIAQNGIAFDLHAARDSIGRKLDRLRVAAGAE